MVSTSPIHSKCFYVLSMLMLLFISCNETTNDNSQSKELIAVVDKDSILRSSIEIGNAAKKNNKLITVMPKLEETKKKYNAKHKNRKEERFQEVCEKLVNGFRRKNFDEINSLIQPELGVYILHRMGIMDIFQHYDSILAKDEFIKRALIEPYLKYDNNIKIKVLYQELPKYSCESEVWSKSGNFTDTVKSMNSITSIIKYREFVLEEKYDSSLISKINFIEKNSRQVIFTDIGDSSFIISMIYINNQWYIITINLLITDCST